MTKTRFLLKKITKYINKKNDRDLSNSETQIKIRGLCKSFGKKNVLKGIDLDIKKGESLVVIGGSGSGKSVLIKIILGLIQPSMGSIKFDNIEISSLNYRERNKLMTRFGMLFQGGALFDSMPVWVNIAFSLLQNKKISQKDAYQLAISKLADVGLGEEVAKLFPAELSGGMQKRVALARAIATNPEVIFFDEPTTGLDPIMADIINELIIKCSRQLGATTITITHDMHSVRRIADNVAMLYEGKFIWQGSASDLDNSDNPYVEQFIKGSSKGPIKMKIQDH